MDAGKKIVVALVLTALFSTGSEAAEVKNVITSQVGSSLSIGYDLLGDDSETEVTLILKLNGRSYNGSQLHLKGDVGAVRLGSGKVMYWDILKDFPKGYSGQVDGEVAAKNKTRATYPSAAGNDGNDIVYPAKNGNIRFSHKGHSSTLECRACHGDGAPAKILIDKNKAHALCKGCHSDRNAGPTRCGECHKKNN
jgi:hypothetical protein